MLFTTLELFNVKNINILFIFNIKKLLLLCTKVNIHTNIHTVNRGISSLFINQRAFWDM